MVPKLAHATLCWHHTVRRDTIDIQTPLCYSRPLFILRPYKLIVFIYLQGIDIR